MNPHLYFDGFLTRDLADALQAFLTRPRRIGHSGTIRKFGSLLPDHRPSTRRPLPWPYNPHTGQANPDYLACLPPDETKPDETP